MLYNKFQFNKVNDKKVLRKVKKQWVVVSISMLALLGGGSVFEHATTVHASTTDTTGSSNTNNVSSTYTSSSTTNGSASNSTNNANSNGNAIASANVTNTSNSSFNNDGQKTSNTSSNSVSSSTESSVASSSSKDSSEVDSSSASGSSKDSSSADSSASSDSPKSSSSADSSSTSSNGSTSASSSSDQSNNSLAIDLANISAFQLADFEAALATTDVNDANGSPSFSKDNINSQASLVASQASSISASLASMAAIVSSAYIRTERFQGASMSSNEQGESGANLWDYYQVTSKAYTRYSVAYNDAIVNSAFASDAAQSAAQSNVSQDSLNSLYEYVSSVQSNVASAGVVTVINYNLASGLTSYTSSAYNSLESAATSAGSNVAGTTNNTVNII